MRDELIASVKKHEGFRNRAYKDSVGVWTIGYGTNVEVLEVDQETAEKWLIAHLERTEEELRGVDGFLSCSPVRQDVLVEMAYQLGVAGCLKFVRMWEAIRAGDYNSACFEMLDSRWARQTPSRSRRLARRMKTNSWEA